MLTIIVYALMLWAGVHEYHVVLGFQIVMFIWSVVVDVLLFGTFGNFVSAIKTNSDAKQALTVAALEMLNKASAAAREYADKRKAEAKKNDEYLARIEHLFKIVNEKK